MNKNFFEGGLYQLLTNISQLVVVSILWLFTSIPLLTIGTSTAALYHVITKGIREDHAHLYKMYFKAFKDNFRASIVPTILFLLYAVVMSMELSNAYLGKSDYWISPYFWFALCFLLTSLFIMIFALIARVEAPFIAILRLAIVIFTSKPVVFFALVGLLAAFGALIYFLPGIAFFVPSIVLFILSFLLEPEIYRHMSNDSSNS